MILPTPTEQTLEDALEVTKKNSGEGCVGGMEAQASVRLSRLVRLWASGAVRTGKVDAYPTSEERRKRHDLPG